MPPATREATVDDLDRLESLTLEDFDVDLSRVKMPEKPPGERLTQDELNTAVESFLDSLKTR
jgi:type IV secretion system protein VirD4